MQRGDRVIKIAILSAIAVIALTAIVMYQTKTSVSGKVFESSQFINERDDSLCNLVVCERYKEAYYLGFQGSFAKCCCPEDYTGNGWCREIKYIGV